MSTNIRQTARRAVMVGLLVGIALLEPNVSVAEIGGIRTDRSVRNDVEAYRYDSDYRYYYLGRYNSPIAIIGLQKDYAFKDISWTEVDPNSEKFRHVIELVKRFPQPDRPAIGAHLLDGKNKTIGVYYSGAGVGLLVDNANKSVFIAVNPNAASGRP